MREPSKSAVGRERGDSIDEIAEDIAEAYSNDKITKLHYDLLNEKISKLTQEKD